MSRSAILLALFPLAAAACDGPAQRKPEPDSARQSSSAASSGGSDNIKFQISGSPSCKHAPIASIYGVPAALWMVEYSNPDDPRVKRLNLTLWRPNDGSAEQFSLALETGSGSHRIQRGGRGEQIGSGTVTLSQSGPGGRFEIKGKDGTGTAVELAIDCPTFGGIEAEGG